MSRWTAGERAAGEEQPTTSLVKRHHLKAIAVAADGRKVVVPQPLERLLAALDADPGVRVGDELEVVLGAVLVVPLGPAGAQQQDVARQELDAAVLGHLLDLRHRDGVRRHRAVRDALARRIRHVVEQHASADDAAALRPVLRSVSRRQNSESKKDRKAEGGTHCQCPACRSAAGRRGGCRCSSSRSASHPSGLLVSGGRQRGDDKRLQPHSRSPSHWLPTCVLKLISSS